ncbi:hypothetical protein acdb102_46950 [Acidothermaceae bacterium B102]|nr:hypothetical protein acdb102_46950 [Acidothermaceae bacterium B102]
MAAYTKSIEISAPPAAVAELLLDLPGWPTWTASVNEVTPLGGEPVAPGTRVRVRQPRLPVAVWTVDAIGDYHFDWNSHSPGVTTVATHRILPTNTGCTVTLSINQSGRLSRLATLVYGGLTERYLSLEAEGLKAAAESSR